MIPDRRILLQFHITGRCNLRCKHCYRLEGDVEPLSYDDICSVIHQFIELKNRYNETHKINRKGHINITGGEPFIRKDIREILRLLGSYKDDFSVGFLSNGSFINNEIIQLLKSIDVSFVQLSIDGNRETHDYLRAEGDYDRVFSKAEMLEKNGIRTYISCTANRSNYRDIPSIASECRKRKITKLWSDRLVPIGEGEGLSDLIITPEILPDYIKTMKKAQKSIPGRLLHPKTQVTMNRALQFLNSDGDIYSCSAGSSLITVDEFGNIMPCRRMPLICGNIASSTLKEIYFGHETFRDLRNDRIPKECSECIYKNLCKGGAKCQSYAAYGSYNRADPACPLKIR